jgi:anaerobic selenocysteine-containing dehydrogenase
VQYPEFIVVIDIVASEMASYADVVLPDTTYLERYDDLHTPGWKTPYVALRQPVVKPLYNSKPAWWIAKELAKRMGLSKYFPYNDIEDYLKKRAELTGIDFATLKKYGVITKKVSDSTLYGYEHIRKPIHLYSKKLASLGFDPVPKYVRHPQPKQGYYRLIYGRAPVHTFTRTAINKYLLESSLELLVGCTLVSEVTRGPAVSLSPLETVLFYFALSEGVGKSVARAYEYLQSLDKTLKIRGEEKKAKEISKEELEKTGERLFKGRKAFNLQRLGIVLPA